LKKRPELPDPLLRGLCVAIQRRREALGISQEEVATRSGLHRTYISDIERGSRNPTLKTLARLTVALEISASDLIKQAETYGGTPTAIGSRV
jgi:transcriptional regulator with XRE-family HTH domain